MRNLHKGASLALNDIFMDMMKNGIYEASVITHGGVIAMLMTLIAFPRKPTPEWTCDNGCGFTVQTTPRKCGQGTA